MANNFLSNGLLGMGGIGGVGGAQPAFSSLLGDLYDPNEARKAQMKQMLLGMGMGLMSEKGFGRGAELALAMGSRAGDDYRQSALDAYRLKSAEEERAENREWRMDERDYRRGIDQENRTRQNRADAWQNTQMDWQMQDRQQQEDMRAGQQNQVQDWMGGFEAQGGNLFSPEMQQGLRQQGIQGVDPRDTQKYERMQPLVGARMYPQAFEQMMAEPAKPDLPNSYEEYLLAMQDPAFAAHQERLKRAGASQQNVTVPIGQEPPDGKLRQELAGEEAKVWKTYKEAADQAGPLVQDLQVIDELSQAAPQGPITGRLAEAFPGVSSAGDAYQSVVARVAPSLRTPGSGSTSDIEYEGFMKSLPRLRNTPEGNAVISAVLQAKAEVNIRRGEIVDAYLNNEMSAVDARKALGELNRQSIMTPQIKQLIQATGGTKPAAEMTDEELLKELQGGN
jgi:hypothetical protein